jgi:PAS domain S-box-containing protein
MTRLPRTVQAHWLRLSTLRWISASFALMVLGLGAVAGWYGRADIERQALQSTEALARALEDHANQAFNTVDVTLATLSEAVRFDGIYAGEPLRLQQALAQAQASNPMLRSLSVLDGRGRVLASSAADNVGVRIDLKRLGTPGLGAVDKLSELTAGRDLADFAAIVAAEVQGLPAPVSRRAFLSLVRQAAGEQLRYVVAVLNPGFFDNRHSLMLPDSGHAAALFGINGRLISATEGIRLLPGQQLAAHRIFGDYLPAIESAAFIGVGIDGDKAVTAFRTLRHRPIAVVVERSFASLQDEFFELTAMIGCLIGAALLAIGGVFVLSLRNLRQHEILQSALEVSREQVAASEQDMRLLVEGVEELIFRTDALGVITFVNGRWQQLTGRSAAEARGRHLSELCLPDDRASVEALLLLGTAAPTRKPSPLLVRIQGAQRVCLLELVAVPVFRPDGSLLAFAGSASDVTERQRTQDALQSQLDLTARLFEVSPTALFVKDELGRFTSVNRAWLELMDLTSEQALGRNSAQIFGPMADAHLAYDMKLLAVGTTVRYENSLKRRNRPLRETLVAKVLLTHSDGSPAGVVGSITDLTEFRQTERRLLLAQQSVVQATRAKLAFERSFISMAAHELRTPLSGLRLETQLLAAAVEPGERKERNDNLLASVDRVSHVLSQLMLLSRVDGLSYAAADMGTIDLELMYFKVMSDLQERAVEREIRLRAQLSGYSVTGIEFCVFTIMRNLLDNALHYTPVGAQVRIWAESTDTAVAFIIDDSGPGIPVELRERAFERFYRLSRQQPKGAGLGLSIVRSIALLHGIKVVLQDSPLGGLRVRVVFERDPVELKVERDSHLVDLNPPAVVGGVPS